MEEKEKKKNIYTPISIAGILKDGGIESADIVFDPNKTRFEIFEVFEVIVEFEVRVDY